MKTLRKVCAATVLACVFAVPVCAGDIHTPTVTAPPPPDPPPASAQASEETDATGDLTLDTIAALLNGLLIVL